MPDVYYLAVYLAWLVGSIGIGLLATPSQLTLAVVFGVCINVMLQFPEGGPGLCVGSVVMPVGSIMVMYVGRGLRYALEVWGVLRPYIRRVPEPPGPTCEHCGYLLIGLETPRCPECGRAFVPGTTPRKASGFALDTWHEDMEQSARRRQ